MKKSLGISLPLVCIVLLISIQVASVRGASDLEENLVQGFIQNALPIDTSKYNITLTKHAGSYGSAIDCRLTSDQSMLTVNCYLQNNVLRGCNLYISKGSIAYDKSYANLTDVATGFLEKYQTFTKRDSNELINSLRGIDMIKNSTSVSGITKLTITTKSNNTTDYTSFTWTLNIEGVDYPLMSISFDHGVFYGFTDSRGIYTIGDTSINISKEKAINTAMECVKNYSYIMHNNSRISGFNVVEDRTIAELTCAVSNSTSLLYPVWNVRLFLNQTYPGSVNNFLITIWAGSGEVHNIGHGGPGGGIDPQNTQAPEENSLSSSPNVYIVIAAVVLNALAIIAIAVLEKRRRKIN